MRMMSLFVIIHCRHDRCQDSRASPGAAWPRSSSAICRPSHPACTYAHPNAPTTTTHSCCGRKAIRPQLGFVISDRRLQSERPALCGHNHGVPAACLLDETLTVYTYIEASLPFINVNRCSREQPDVVLMIRPDLPWSLSCFLFVLSLFRQSN